MRHLLSWLQWQSSLATRKGCWFLIPIFLLMPAVKQPVRERRWPRAVSWTITTTHFEAVMFFLHLLCSSIIIVIVIVITLITALPIITVTIWVNWTLSYPEGKGKRWEAQWWAKIQGGKKQHEFHFCSPCKVSPKEPKADSWGTEECWTAGALLMAQPATTSRLRSGTAPVVMLDFLLILLLISFFFLPSPSRTCRDVLWAGVTSRCSHQQQDLTHMKGQKPWVPHWGSACCFHAWSCPSNAHKNKKSHIILSAREDTPLLPAQLCDTRCSPAELPITEPAC